MYTWALERDGIHSRRLWRASTNARAYSLEIGIIEGFDIVEMETVLDAFRAAYWEMKANGTTVEVRCTNCYNEDPLVNSGRNSD